MNTRGLVGFGITSLFVFLIFLGSTRDMRASEYLFKVGGNNSVTNAQIIPEPKDQHYLYAKMSAGPELIDYYNLNFDDYTAQVVVELLIPKSIGKDDFRPQLIFSDPLNRYTEGVLPFNYPANLTGRVFTWGETARITTDVRTGEQFWVGPSFVKDMAPNKYTIAVYDPAGAGGNYVLKVGAAPKAETLKDKLFFFWSWLRIKLQLY